MNIVDKLREWQRGEREWDQADMVREVLDALIAKEVELDDLYLQIAYGASHD